MEPRQPIIGDGLGCKAKRATGSEPRRDRPRHRIDWHLKPLVTRLRAVLFDFDGTFVDSESLHHESWLDATEPWGVTISWEDYKRQMIGISDRRACEYFLTEAGLDRTDELVALGCSRKHRAYRERSVNELKVDHAVGAWIRENAANVPLAVVSSSAIEDVVPILEAQGVDHYLRFVICGDHVERLKPDPMPYQLAFNKLAALDVVASPTEVLVFEDSDAGFRSAKAAGMTTHRLGAPSELGVALTEWTGQIVGAARAAA